MNPGDYEDTFIKAGGSDPGKGLGWAAFAHWEVGEKGALGTGSGD